MSHSRATLAAFLALLLAGCALGRPVPQPATYAVEIPPPAAHLSRRPETLSMGRVRVAPAFSGRSLVFRLDAVRYTTDYDNGLIADPGDLLAARMAAWLDRAGPFRAVIQPGSYKGSALVLEAVVTELYGDIRPDRRPAAVVEVQFRLVDLRGLTPKTLLERTIGRRIELPEASPSALVQGYGTALGEILTELAREMADARG